MREIALAKRRVTVRIVVKVRVDPQAMKDGRQIAQQVQGWVEGFTGIHERVSDAVGLAPEGWEIEGSSSSVKESIL